jgi:hypothetical protein
MAKTGLKYIVVDSDTKIAFDAVVAGAMQSADRDLKVTQDYVVRLALAALLEKLDQQKQEREHASSN